jgi:hypothetical protein
VESMTLVINEKSTYKNQIVKRKGTVRCGEGGVRACEEIMEWISHKSVMRV